MAKRKGRVSLKQRIKNAAAKRKSDGKLTNRIIDGITISFGVQNMLPTTISSGGNLMSRLKSAANELTGRTTGLNVFPDAPQFTRRFSIENAITNPQTIAGITALVYSTIGKKFKVLPLKSEAKRFAKKNIAVGFGTGLFGDPNTNPIGSAISLAIPTGNSNSNQNIGAA